MKALKICLSISLALSVILCASILTAQKKPKPMMRCEENFVKMDTDKDGKLSLAEFKAGEHPRGNVEKLFNVKDADKDGFLTKEELCSKGMGHEKCSMMKCDECFVKMDADKDGKISLAEFKTIEHPGGNPEKLFKLKDADKDGSLTKEELCSKGMMHENRPMMRCEDNFAKMDTDKDGKLSLAEFKAGEHPGGDPEKLFKSRDADKDGFLTKEELCSKGMGHGRHPGPGRAK